MVFLDSDDKLLEQDGKVAKVGRGRRVSLPMRSSAEPRHAARHCPVRRDEEYPARQYESASRRSPSRGARSGDRLHEDEGHIAAEQGKDVRRRYASGRADRAFERGRRRKGARVDFRNLRRREAAGRPGKLATASWVRQGPSQAGRRVVRLAEAPRVGPGPAPARCRVVQGRAHQEHRPDLGGGGQRRRDVQRGHDAVEVDASAVRVKQTLADNRITHTRASGALHCQSRHGKRRLV